MLEIYHIIVNQGIVKISRIDIELVVFCADCSLSHIGQQDAGDPLLQHIVGLFCEVCVYGQVDVLAGNGVYGIGSLEYFSHIVYIQGLRALCPLERILVVGLYPGLADLIVL